MPYNKNISLHIAHYGISDGQRFTYVCIVNYTTMPLMANASSLLSTDKTGLKSILIYQLKFCKYECYLVLFLMQER